MEEQETLQISKYISIQDAGKVKDFHFIVWLLYIGMLRWVFCFVCFLSIYSSLRKPHIYLIFQKSISKKYLEHAVTQEGWSLRMALRYPMWLIPACCLRKLAWGLSKGVHLCPDSSLGVVSACCPNHVYNQGEGKHLSSVAIFLFFVFFNLSYSPEKNSCASMTKSLAMSRKQLSCYSDFDPVSL